MNLVTTDLDGRTALLSAPSELAPGDRVRGAPYVVVRRLGQGGMGEVYEVEHVELGRRAAMKILHRRHLGRADLAARMRVEARALAQLAHPNLVEVFDLGATADGRPWFAMPLLRGRDLREELARTGPLGAPSAARLARQALAGLGAAHARGIVHRDVKLENLFLEQGGTLRVLDFGVARFLDRTAGSALISPLTAHGVSLGTPRWMAPEQCVCGPVDARTDVYAVGLVLYELATGRGPFDEAKGSEHALRYAHCARTPSPPSAHARTPLPMAFDAIVLRALAKDPGERFASAAAMAAALATLTGVAFSLGETPKPPREASMAAEPVSRPWPAPRSFRRGGHRQARPADLFARL